MNVCRTNEWKFWENIGMLRQEHHRFEAIMGYRENSRQVWAVREWSQGNKRFHLLPALGFFFFKHSVILMCIRRLFLSSTLCKVLPLVLLIYLTLQQTEGCTHFWAQTVGVHELWCPFHFQCTGLINFKTKSVNKWKVLPNLIQEGTEPRPLISQSQSEAVSLWRLHCCK